MGVWGLESFSITPPLAEATAAGPLVDRCRRVVGLNTKKRHSEVNDDEWVPMYEGIGFALSAGELSRKLKELEIEAITDTDGCEVQ